LKSLGILASFGAKLTYGCLFLCLQAKQQAAWNARIAIFRLNRARRSYPSMALRRRSISASATPARQFLAPPFEKVYFFGFVMPIRTYWLLHP
jgi:hypothetical protein